MFTLMFKKTFFDMWDNMLRLILLNIGLLILICFFLFLLNLARSQIVLFYSILGIAFIGMICYNGVIARFTLEISDYNLPDFRDFFGFFKETFAASLFLSVILAFYLMIIFVSIPFYLKIGNIVGLAGVSIIFWISVIFFLSLIYYYPVFGRLNKQPTKILKKCFIIFFDNLGFTIFIAIGMIVILLLSTFLGFILPGLSTIALWVNAGLKLRLLKYDYLEANPDTNRRKIPWASLIAEENDILGKRTFKDFIFPAKQ